MLQKQLEYIKKNAFDIKDKTANKKKTETIEQTNT